MFDLKGTKMLCSTVLWHIICICIYLYCVVQTESTTNIFWCAMTVVLCYSAQCVLFVCNLWLTFTLAWYCLPVCVYTQEQETVICRLARWLLLSVKYPCLTWVMSTVGICNGCCASLATNHYISTSILQTSGLIHSTLETHQDELWYHWIWYIKNGYF